MEEVQNQTLIERKYMLESNRIERKLNKTPKIFKGKAEVEK